MHHGLQHLRRAPPPACRPRGRRATMRFWSAGTSSGGISTPRSPRATMTASDSSIDLLQPLDGRRLLRAWPASPARPPISRRASATSSGPLHEGQRDPVDAEVEAELAGPRGPSSVRAESGSSDARHVDALAVAELAADHDRGLREIAAAALRPAAAACRHRAAGRCPASSAAKISGWGSGAARRVALPSASRSSRKRCAGLRDRRRPPAKVADRSFGPCRSIMMPIGRPRLGLDLPDGSRSARW